MAKQEVEQAFLVAASVPREGWHGGGDLRAAEALLAEHPELASASICTAAVLGEVAAVREWLARDPALATAKHPPYDWDSLTYLCFSRYLRLAPARGAGLLASAEALLAAGASANTGWFEPGHQPKPCFESAIYGAAGIAQHAGLTQLLLTHGAEPNDDETPYHVPESYDLATLRVMLASGRLTADSLATVLLRKADWHDLAGVELALAHGADPNRPTQWGHSALHQSLRRDNAMPILTALLAKGADPSRPNAAGLSALVMAARRGRGDALTRFAAQGWPAPDQGLDGLLAACAMANTTAARQHLAATPALAGELAARAGEWLCTFAGNGNRAGVAVLLDLGLPVTARDEAGDGYFGVPPGSQALHVAAWRARHETVSLLLARGAPVNATDGKGATPLQLAVRACVASHWASRRQPDSIAALLAAGAERTGITRPTGYPEADALLAK